MRGAGRQRIAAVLATLLIVILAGPAAAQQGGAPPRWELGVAWGVASPAFDSDYESSYTPVLAYHPETTGSAGQTLFLEADDADFLAATLDYRSVRRSVCACWSGGTSRTSSDRRPTTAT